MDGLPPEDDTEERRGYLHRNALPLGVIAAFALLGWFLGPLVVPDASPFTAGFAGAWIGAFGGAATVLNRSLD